MSLVAVSDLFYCQSLPTSYMIDQRQILFWQYGYTYACWYQQK